MTLAPLAPDSSRSGRVRSICRGRLERSRRRADGLAAAAHAGQQLVAPLVALLAVAYVVNLAAVALHMFSPLK